MSINTTDDNLSSQQPAPLKGVRVLAVEQYGAGPFGTSYLASLGAEVIKIENPKDGGDVSRSLGPYFLGGDTPSNDSLFFQGLNIGKKSFTLDLTKPQGHAVLVDLARNSDALITNLRGDVPQKLGLCYEQLRHSNKALVCAHLSAYGRNNERANWPGYDYMMQAETGYFYLTGSAGDDPTRCGLSIIDFMAGVTTAFALSAGLLQARQTGIGRDLDVSLFDVALYNLNYLALWQLNAGYKQERIPRSAHYSLCPCQLYRTKDGWIYLMCNKEKFWEVLCNKIGHPEWINDERFHNFECRGRHRDLLTELLDGALQHKSTNEWLAHFNGQPPAAPVLNMQQALSNSFIKENHKLLEVAHNNLSFRTIRNPVHFESEATPQTTSPELGADNHQILKQAGYTEEQIEKLENNNII